MKKAPILRKIVLSVLLIVAFLVGGVLLVVVGMALKEEPAREDAPPQPIPVNGVVLERGDVVEKLRGYGLAEPIRRADIASQVSGTIDRIPEGLRVGARVEAGDVLAEIDRTEYEARVRETEARVAEVQEQLEINRAEREEAAEKFALIGQDIELANAELRRAEDLLKEGALSESARDQARTSLQATQQRLSDIRRQMAVLEAGERQLRASLRAVESILKLAETNLAYTTPRAPFSGVIEQRMVDKGDLVQPGQGLFIIIDRSAIELPIEIPASQAQALQAGARSVILTEESPPRVIEGVVDRVSPSVNPQTRTVRAFLMIVVPEGQEPLAPGTFLSAAIDGRVFEDVYAIPRSAIVDGSIYVAYEGRAHEMTPDFFVFLEDVALTREELGEGRTLITSGFEEIYDNAPVETPERKSFEAGAETSPGQIAVQTTGETG